MHDRFHAAIARMRIEPHHHILEIGCGHGVAADLICARLAQGRFVAIDRSGKMIAAATRRNARHIAAGLAKFQVSPLESFDPGAQKFDTILALRVGLFRRDPTRARRLIASWLKPGGKLIAEFDEPSRSAAITDRVKRNRRRRCRAKTVSPALARLTLHRAPHRECGQRREEPV